MPKKREYVVVKEKPPEPIPDTVIPVVFWSKRGNWTALQEDARICTNLREAKEICKSVGGAMVIADYETPQKRVCYTKK